MRSSDYLVVDQGKTFVLKKLRGERSVSGTNREEDPIETLGAIGTVEQYHAPQRAAFGGT